MTHRRSTRWKGRRFSSLERASETRAAHPADALLRQHDAIRDRRPAGPLADARVTPALPVSRLPARATAGRRTGTRDDRRIMKTATGLALIAVGAIFAFAVSAQAPG